jgi:hypothetical protein
MRVTTEKRDVPGPLGLGSASWHGPLSALPLTEAMHIHESNEPSSCGLKSGLAVEGNSSPRKTKSVKALDPTLRQLAGLGAVPSERRSMHLRKERVQSLPRLRRQSGSLENCPETLRGLGCCTFNGRAKESGEEGRSPRFSEGASLGAHECCRPPPRRAKLENDDVQSPRQLFRRSRPSVTRAFVPDVTEGPFGFGDQNWSRAQLLGSKKSCW